MTSLRKRVTVGLVGAAVVAGGGIAYAASQSSDPRDAYLNDVAKRLNVTPEKLREAMKGASLDQVDRAVKDGNLTQEQADRIKKRIEAGGIAGPILGKGFFGAGPGMRGMRGGPTGPGPGPHFGFGFKAFGADLDAVAKYLGLSVADLRKQIADGKSLADIAKAQNKDLDGLKKVITDRARLRLDETVKDGHLSKTQADRIAKKLESGIDELLQLSLPKGLPRGGPRFHHGGPDFPALP